MADSLSNLEKKVEVFYRLANYGDKSSFLKTIAQRMPEPEDGLHALKDIVIAGREVLKLLLADSSSKNNPNIISIVDNLRQIIGKSQDENGRVDVNTAKEIFNLVNKAQGFLSPSPAKANLVKNLNQIGITIQTNLNTIHQLGEDFAVPSESELPTGENLAEQAITPNVKPMQKIDPEIQSDLNDLGYAKPALDIDGWLGPKTQAALDAFRKDHGSPSMNLNTLMEMVKYIHDEEYGPKNPNESPAKLPLQS